MKRSSTLRKALLLLAAVVLALAAWVAVSLLTLPSVAPLVEGKTFGIGFTQISPGELHKLQTVLKKLEDEG